MGTLPWNGGGYQWRELRYECLRLNHTIQASLKTQELRGFSSLFEAFENKEDLNAIMLIFLNFKTTNQWLRTCSKKLKKKVVEDAPYDLSVPQPYILSLFFRRSWQLQALSAWLSQSIRIWMVKFLAQMAWAVGTTCHLSGIAMPFAKADHFRPCSVWLSVGKTMTHQRIQVSMMKPLA